MNTINETINLFRKIMKGIAEQFGPGCEVVLHDYSEDYMHSIVAIENGHVTGRREGDCGTNLGLELIRGVSKIEDEYGYISYSKDGKMLKSSSIYFHDDNDRPIGAMCINWDVSNLAYSENVLKEMLKPANKKQVNEIHTNKISELLDVLIQESIDRVGKPIINMSREDKLEGLKYLDEKGAFLIKKASDRISKAYCISKNTLYNYLDEYKK